MNRLVSATIFISIAFLISFPTIVKAQLIPDNSLGNENSRVIPINPNRDNISGGAVRGANLFHSFQEFNINLGREVYFNNPAGIENILTRVTGANSSNIFGTLGVAGNANLFLINPNGIIFGEGARLDINGAFVSSTAAEIKLGNNGNFSATNPNNSNLLTIEPSALFFNALNNHQSQIRVAGNLEGKLGKTIALLGGNIAIDGGQVSTPSGQIFLGAVNSGTVNLDLNNNTIDYSAVNNFGNIQIIRDANVSADNEDLNGKGIDITADNLLVSQRSQISTDTRGMGNGGTINIKSNLLEISIDSDMEADIEREATGKGGTIAINTDILRIFERSDIQARNRGDGIGGAIDIKANLIEIIGAGSDIRTDVTALATKDATGSKIIIDTDTLRILDAADIQSRSAGIGNVTDPNNPNEDTIFIQARLIEIIGEGADIRADVDEGAEGNSGNIRLETDTLRILERGDIQVDTRGSGNAGNLLINARTIELGTGGGIEADVGNEQPEGRFASGEGGNITINTDRLSLSSGGEITIITFGVGNAGKLNINANSIDISGPLSQIASNVNFTATGQATAAGSITINSNFLRLDNGVISAQTQAPPDGGDITLNINTFLSLRNGSIIRTNAIGQTLQNNGGDIIINSPFILALPRDNAIIAGSENGRGGSIDISSRAIFGFPQFLTINADSGVGIDGNITIDTLNTSPGLIFRQLETSPVDVTAVVDRDLCRLQDGKIARGSSFIITGKGGLPPTPSTPVHAYDNLLDWTEITSENSSFENDKIAPVAIDNHRQITNEEVSFITAKGWIKRPDGSIVLTANPVTNTLPSSNLNHPNCANE